VVKRISLSAQVSRNPRYRVGGLSSGMLALEVRGPENLKRRATDVIENLSLFAEDLRINLHLFTPNGHKLNLGLLKTTETSCIDSLALEADRLILDMIDVPGMEGKVRIMKHELRKETFLEVMKGYEIAGHNADKLRSFLADREKFGSVNFVSLFDAREFAGRFSALTGRKFMVQTEPAWNAAVKLLTGPNFTWTEADLDGAYPYLYARSFDGRFLDCHSPECRYENTAIRLIEIIED